MNITENRTLAWIVLAVCVVLSVCVLGGGALGRERSRVLSVFNDGADTSLSTRHSMDAYLDEAGSQAGIMASEAEMRLGKSDLTAQVQSNAGLIGKDDANLDERAKAYTELKSQVEKLYNNMYNGVSSAEFKDFKVAYDDFWGQDDLMRHDDYHNLAKSYNRLAAGFPASLIGGITGQGSLNPFE